MISRGLLRLVREDQVSEIVVTYQDRLTRFGQEYLQALFDSFGVALTVPDPGEDKTAEQELTDDMLALLASFNCKLITRESLTSMNPAGRGRGAKGAGEIGGTTPRCEAPCGGCCAPHFF